MTLKSAFITYKPQKNALNPNVKKKNNNNN